MKTPQTNYWSAVLSAVTSAGSETLQLLKLRLKFLFVLCGVLATTSVFGQVTRVWTNQVPTGGPGAGDLGTATNWDPNGVPVPTSGPDLNGIYGDELLFDGQTTGDLSLTSDTGLTGFSGSPWGLRVHLTGNQTGSVQFRTLAAISAGTRMQSFQIDSGAGAFHLGDNSANLFDMVMGGVAGQIHNFINNSANPATIYPNARWRHGGGGAHTFNFDGTGDWIVNNVLITANGSPIIVNKSGPGTMTWFSTNPPANIINSVLQGPMVINDGTLILKSSGCFPTIIQNVGINAGALVYDAPSFVQAFPGTINGGGQLRVNAGTLSLSSAFSTFSGPITLSGGTLVAAGAETVGVSGPLGIGGLISFSGGTLAFSANNAFDYSPRFDTAAGQAISIDTAGQIVTFATGLTSSGGTLTKLGAGDLTLAGTSTYSGLTTVSAGTLVLQGPKTGTGNITVADGATLSVVDSGTQVTPATLTLGSSLGADLEFANVTNTTTAPLAASTLVSAGTITISISSDSLSIGSSYPLLTWTTGSAPAVSLGVVDGGGGTLSTNGNTIQFNCTSVALVWSGALNGVWDIINSTNWTQEGSPIGYTDPKQVGFRDTAGASDVTISGVVQPEALTINNVTTPYSITSSSGNIIGGSVRFAKRGSGDATMIGGANTNNGVVTLRGGALIVSTLADGGVASDIGAATSAGANLVFNGGALRYTGGPASINRLFTVGTVGGTIANEGSGPLTLNNPGPVNHNGALTLSGNAADTSTLASALIGGGSVTKSGIGTWVLIGTNGYGGGTEVSAGTLQVSGNGTLGSGNVTIEAGALLDFNRTTTLTVPGSISGNGSVSQTGTGTTILANNNTYSGGTTITAGTLQIGNGGGAGSLAINGPVINDSLLVINRSGSLTLQGAGLISGNGNLVVQAGTLRAFGANSYTGWTRIDSGATFQPCTGNEGALVSSVITNNGTLRLVRQDNLVFIYAGPIVGTGRLQVGANNFNPGDVTLTGVNTYTGGTFIGDNQLILGDGINPGFGSIVGNVQFVNNFDTSDDNARTLTFNRPDDFTFSGNITTNFSSPQNNLGIVQQNGGGTVTLTGNNTYGSGTVINAGTLQVGNGGATGTIGSGPVTVNGSLIFNRTGNLAVGNVTGVGPVTKLASGTVTLTGDSTMGSLDIQAGTFGAAPVGSVGSVTVAGTLTIGSGTTLLVGIDRNLSPSNTVFNAGGISHAGGGTVKLINGGPALQVGDKFTIFNQPVAGLAVVSPGFTVQNDLAVDGSVTVTAVLPPPTITTTVVGGTNLTLSWPAAWIEGMLLQAQTNPLTIGISGNWVTVPGTDVTNLFSVPINKANGTVFYRLTNP